MVVSDGRTHFDDVEVDAPRGAKCQISGSELLYSDIVAVRLPSSRSSRTSLRPASEPDEKKVSAAKTTPTKPDVKTKDAPVLSRATLRSANQAREQNANDATVGQRRLQTERKLESGEDATPSRVNPSRRNFMVGAVDIDAQSASLNLSTNSQGRTIIDGTDDGDQITVSLREGGGLTVQNGAQSVELTEAQAQNLEIRAGGGNDRIAVDPDVHYDLTLRGGEGNDIINGGAGNDRIYGEQGRDFIKGEAGNDYIDGGQDNDRIMGGQGRDVLYGLDGDDRIDGGEGRDYIDGGQGHDRLAGNDGIDQVIGGGGNDNLQGGNGDDVLAGGEGQDTYDGGWGADSIFHQEDEDVSWSPRDTRSVVDLNRGDPGKSIDIVGDAAFEARVLSDLDALRSLPAGRSLLLDMDRTGRKTTIQESQVDGNYFQAAVPMNRLQRNQNTNNGLGTDGTIHYSPSTTDMGENNAWSQFPPVIGLSHEMNHAETAARGAMPVGETDGEANRERIAVGHAIDHDGDPDTPRIQPNKNTENGQRAELNLEPRGSYEE